MKIISLFSGCGGLDLGFKMAGFEIVWANDFDKEACLSYKKNIGKHIVCKDIYDVRENEIPNADILIGGFPCLGFTVANGKNRDINSKYNSLYLEYIRILNAKKPKYFVVENVMGIISGETFKSNFENNILKGFESCGYTTKYRVLNANDYGVAQNRRRIIILGRRIGISQDIHFPKPLKSEKKTLKDAIGDLPENFDDKIPNHIGNAHKVKINGYVGNRILHWNEPSPTITGRGSRGGGAVIHPHPNLKRRLSVRECARIQSFPDDFIFYGSNSACYSQIGNAVPPLMSYHLAREILHYILQGKK